jgi:hypothetical protein
MVRIKVVETVSKDLTQISKNLTTISEGSGSSIPSKLVDWGYYFAISKAPHLSGATKRAVRKVKTKKGAKLQLIEPRQPGRTKPRPYHLWMHGLGGSDLSNGWTTKSGKTNRITSGDPKFMFTTARAMEKHAKKLAEREVRKALKVK